MSVLFHNRGDYGVHINPSTISHPRARMSCVTTNTFAEWEVNEFYDGSFYYETMQDALNTRVFHRDNLIFVTCEQFDASANRLTRRVSTLKRKSTTACLISTSFLFWFVNDLRFLYDEAAQQTKIEAIYGLKISRLAK